MRLYNAMQIADFIINYCTEIGDPVSNLKLQKLLYFLWVEYYKRHRKALFSDSMYAWQFGPVVPSVYYEYCSYGGRPINLKCETEIAAEDEAELKDIINEYRLIPVNELVNRTHEQGTAWYSVYNHGEGNHQRIPFDLLISMI